MHEVDKRGRNFFDDLHLTVLKNRFVIQLNDPLFDALRNEPRFTQVLASIGFDPIT